MKDQKVDDLNVRKQLRANLSRSELGLRIASFLQLSTFLWCCMMTIRESLLYYGQAKIEGGP